MPSTKYTIKKDTDVYPNAGSDKKKRGKKIKTLKKDATCQVTSEKTVVCRRRARPCPSPATPSTAHRPLTPWCCV